MLLEDQKIEMRLQDWAKETGCVVNDRTLVSVPEDTERITIPEGIEIIGMDAFVPEYKRYENYEKAMQIPTVLKEVNLPVSLKKIKVNAFNYCVNLKNLIIPPNVTEIENAAFDNCRGLETVSLPENLLQMGSFVFANCFSLRLLKIPCSVKEILWNFCENCVNLEEIILPDSLELISENAFRNCRKLHQLKFPLSLRKIDKYAFQCCTSLEKITYFGSLQIIGPYAFEGCSSLVQIQGPNTQNFSKAFRNTPYGLAHFPQTGPDLPVRLIGAHMGKWLNDQGYDFFEENRQYIIEEPDQNGVVQVFSWSRTEGPDDDGFGMEQEYDWWLLDENLQRIPGIDYWHDFSHGDMRCNQNRWAELRNEAGQILKRSSANSVNHDKASKNLDELPPPPIVIEEKMLNGFRKEENYMEKSKTIYIHLDKECHIRVPFVVRINGKEIGIIKKGITLEATVTDEDIYILFLPKSLKWFGWKSLCVTATPTEDDNIILNLREQKNNILYKGQLNIYEYSGLKTINQEYFKQGKEPKIFTEVTKCTANSSSNKQETIIDIMLALAEVKLNEGQEEQAVEQYKRILELTPNIDAQYNLGCLYAQGKGVAQDFCEAAYWFKQAEKGGDEQAAKLVLKCELDYINQYVENDTYDELYQKYNYFINKIYPDEKEIYLGQKFYLLADYYVNNKHDYSYVAKLLKAGAILCHDGHCQNLLGYLYNSGIGVENNDLIALYWFDQAVDQCIHDAKADRDGILNAYKKSLSADEFKKYMQLLANWCENGTEDIPKTPDKTQYWLNFA